MPDLFIPLWPRVRRGASWHAAVRWVRTKALLIADDASAPNLKTLDPYKCSVEIDVFAVFLRNDAIRLRPGYS